MPKHSTLHRKTKRLHQLLTFLGKGGVTPGKDLSRSYDGFGVVGALPAFSWSFSSLASLIFHAAYLTNFVTEWCSVCQTLSALPNPLCVFQGSSMRKTLSVPIWRQCSARRTQAVRKGPYCSRWQSLQFPERPSGCPTANLKPCQPPGFSLSLSWFLSQTKVTRNETNGCEHLATKPVPWPWGTPDSEPSHKHLASLDSQS